MLLAGAAFAQDETVISDPEPTGQAQADTPSMKFGLSAGEYWFDINAQYAPAGEIGSDGELKTWRSTAEIGAMYPLGVRDRLWVSFNTEYVNTDFKRTHEFAPDGDLYDDLIAYSLNVRSLTHLQGRWSLLMGASGTSAGEAHAEFDQSLTYRAAVGFSYSVNPNLQIGVMAAVATRIEEDTAFIPVPILELAYKFDEKWRAEVSTFSGAKVVYSPTHTLDLSLSAKWSYTEYRLDDDGPFEGGVFRETRVPVAFGADWRFKPQYKLNVNVGMNVYNDWDFDDDNGNDIFDENVDSDFFMGLGLRIDF